MIIYDFKHRIKIRKFRFLTKRNAALMIKGRFIIKNLNLLKENDLHLYSCSIQTKKNTEN